jgi:hypothetical protein
MACLSSVPGVGAAKGSGRNAALPICFTRVPGTAEATPRV